MELGNTDNAKRHESLEACVKMIMDHTDGSYGWRYGES